MRVEVTSADAWYYAWPDRLKSYGDEDASRLSLPLHETEKSFLSRYAVLVISKAISFVSRLIKHSSWEIWLIELFIWIMKTARDNYYFHCLSLLQQIKVYRHKILARFGLMHVSRQMQPLLCENKNLNCNRFYRWLERTYLCGSACWFRRRSMKF